MRIEQLRLEDPRVPPLGAGTLSFAPGLNVVGGHGPLKQKTLADLVGHVLYGARLESATGDAPAAAGHVDVASPLGRFRLARHGELVDRGTFREPRLTVAPLDGQPADAHTARKLLGGLSPEIAARLMVLSSTGSGQLKWLLSAELAAELHRLDGEASRADDAPHDQDLARPDLFARRDELTRQLETMLAERRRTSERLETTLRALDAEGQQRTEAMAEANRELERVVAELAELEAQWRYHELAEFIRRASNEAHHADQLPSLAELDGEIDRWRRTLADLEARHAHVRSAIARLHPDDHSPRLPLADQRASITIAQRLVSDLDSEIARFARTGDSSACHCRHTHARLHPLVDTLGQQVDKVARLMNEYEAALELEQLRAEATHLTRAESELRATLDHLLDRRQSRLRTTRVREAQPVETEPADTSAVRAELERRRSELASTIAADEQRLGELHAQRERLERERAGLMSDAALDRLRRELDLVNAQLDRSPARGGEPAAPAAAWRASDILAQLTDGRLREVRLTHGGREATVVDRRGNLLPLAERDETDRRLVALSLQLAAVAGVARWGARLPLVLIEPFDELPDATAAILALVLHDFARAGHQVVVFTASQVALERWRAIGQAILPVDVVESQPVAATPCAAVEQPAVAETDAFALQLDDSMERFAVFGDDTRRLFEAAGIRTVGDLIAADASDVARRLDRTGIGAAVVELWQTHLVLLTFVPDLSLAEAQLLTGAGVSDPDQLAGCDVDELVEAVRAYLASPSGSRLSASRATFDRNRAAAWVAAARREHERWRTSPVARRWQQRRTAQRKAAATTPPRSLGGRKRSIKKRPLRFRLSRKSAVADAPSIGPKTAKRLDKIGIKTVAHLLAADAEQAAEQLDLPHVSAETLVAWQHQAQLMCRVPELLARDAQLLVGCGFTTAEDIAAAAVADLLEFAKSYAATPAGARVLRGGDPPDLARVKKWIRWAGHRRAIEAA